MKCIRCDKELNATEVSGSYCKNCIDEEHEKAINLLNEVVDRAVDLTPQKTEDEKYEISGSLFNEVYNFLQNNNLRG